MDHEIVSGKIPEEIIEIAGVDGLDIIVNVKFRIYKNLIEGQARLMEKEHFDMAVLYLLRKWFHMEYPMIIIGEFRKHKIMMMKIFSYRDLRIEDYYPPTRENVLFRIELAKIVFFYHFIGSPFDLTYVKVVQGLPVSWKCRYLGLRGAPSVTPKEFERIFGMTLDDARNNKLSNLARVIIEQFLEVDFDTDVLRGLLYLRCQEMRWSKGQRTKYKLSRRNRQIEDTIEENYLLIQGNYPFRIFRTSNI